ncbi:NUMOD4 domain-containing protein [Corynebacterium sp. 805_CJEI]|uniref:NUMOD4 domain-containing protein n=1 Tax=Corynebacterium sp. 805_CJEI TaxID=2715677 RepID=UPI0009B949C7
MPDEEVWKVYPRCKYYEVSNMGRVRSVDRVVRTKHGRTWVQKGRILTHCVNKNGRCCLRLSENGHRWTVQVSHMVAETFIRLRKNSNEVVRHLNDVSTDNRLENLAIGTYKDNSEDALRNKKNVNANKTHCKHGHEFNAWNTVVENNGRARHCHACRLARSYMHYPKNKNLDFKTVSDSYYLKLKDRYINAKVSNGPIRNCG